MLFRSEHLTAKGIEAKIYTLKIPGQQTALDDAFAKYSGKPDPDSRLLKKFSKKGINNLSITDSTWFQGYDNEVDGIRWEKGAHSFSLKGYPSVIVIRNIIDPVPLPFDKVQGIMMAGYQEKLENDWIEQLKDKYSVKVDSNEFNNVKKRISNE